MQTQRACRSRAGNEAASEGTAAAPPGATAPPCPFARAGRNGSNALARRLEYAERSLPCRGYSTWSLHSGEA